VLPPSKTSALPKEDAAGARSLYQKPALTHEQLMQGISQHITLERVAVQTVEGNCYMGHTSDRHADQKTFASVVAYGTPEQVTHCLAYAVVPYQDFPDPKSYPEYMKRNLQIVEAFLANVCGGKISDEVRGALEWAGKNPNEERVLYAGGWAIKLSYSPLEKGITIDVK
jgi:hypothetical protein